MKSLPLSGRLPGLEWAVAMAPRSGETRSGDLHVVHALPSGALVAVCDGLGHGEDAALAAECAAEVLGANSSRPVAALVQSCHAALQRTRGVVMGLAQLDIHRQSLSWLSVGNVDGVLVRQNIARRIEQEAVVMRAGVVGHRLPELRPASATLNVGDILVFATDGIAEDFRDALDPAQAPETLSRRILAGFRRDTDDALVLVARFLGANPCELSSS
jgi:serine phosphatase RsbU (regulator of sigma subunit)